MRQLHKVATAVSADYAAVYTLLIHMLRASHI